MKILSVNSGKFLNIILAIVLIAIFLIFNVSYAFSNSLYNNMRFPTDNFCMLSIAQNSNRLVNRNPSVFSNSDLDILLQDRHVKYVSGHSFLSVSSVRSHGAQIDVNSMRQVGSDFFRIMNMAAQSGDLDIDNHCVIGYQLAQNYNLAPGDKLEYTTYDGLSKEMIISGIIKELKPQKFSTLVSSFNNAIIISGNNNQLFSLVFLDIESKNNSELKKICSRLEEKLNKNSPAVSKITKYEKIVIQNRIDMKDTLNVIYNNFYVFIYIMTLLIIVICMIGVYSKILLMLMLSKVELSILKQIGADNWMITRILILRFLPVVLWPLVISLVISIGLQFFICYMMSFPIVFDYLNMSLMILLTIIFMFISVIAASQKVLRNTK